MQWVLRRFVHILELLANMVRRIANNEKLLEYAISRWI